MKNAMTIDVEDYFQVSAFADNVDRSEWDERESRVVRNTQKTLAIFEDAAVKATFFVLGWVADRHPDLVKLIAAQGHEVACHGYSHQLIYRQTRETFRDETLRAKAVLEDLVQKPVVGYRAASYSITAETLWALDTLVELGFAYDSSIFPIRHDRYGIPNSRREPHVLGTPLGHTIVEFPPSTVELGKYRLPVSGGGYFRLFPYFVTRSALQYINGSERRPFIFYLHPWEVDPQQPRIDASLVSRFRHYNNLKKTEPRLRQLLSDFSFTTVARVLQDLQLL